MMIIFHLMWDLWYFGVRPETVLYSGFWKYFQRTIPILFLSLAGVSLTVAEISDDAFEVALIPTTLDLTTLGRAAVGAQINLETDYVAKIVVGYLRTAGLPTVGT